MQPTVEVTIEEHRKIGLLGMPDNIGSRSMLKHLAKNGISVDVVVHWKPGSRDQARRVIRKLKSSGLSATVRRIFYALTSSKDTEGSNHLCQSMGRSYYVSSHNSKECGDILSREGIDILLLVTDAIINKRILAIPKLATLNAHPAWLPRFRGLGSTIVQLEHGYLPSISVHQVDEGIDTGPVLLRESFDWDSKCGLAGLEEEISRIRARMLAKCIRLLVAGDARPIDVFNEPSNMTRGVSFRRAKRLDTALKAGRVTLRSIEGG